VANRALEPVGESRERQPELRPSPVTTPAPIILSNR
jgi:hypothetical protein